MQRKKRRAITIVGILLLVIVIAGISVVQAIKSTPPAVTTLVPEQTDLARTIVISGTVAAGETFEMTLSPTQKVFAVHRKAGDRVEAGEALLELDTTDLQYQIGKIEATIAQLKASTAIAREQARLTLANAQLALSQARKNDSDAREQYEDDRITALVRDQASTALKTAENQVKLAQATYNSLDIESENSDRKKQIDAANLDIENLRGKIADGSIRTPIAGTVMTLDARAGQFPTQQTALIRIIELENLKIEARVDQYEAVQLAVDQAVRIRVKGLEGELGGRIAAIDDVATLQGGASALSKYTVTITIDPAAPTDALRPGYEVDARVILDLRPDALTLPDTVIRSESGTKHVLAVRDSRVIRLDIQTGLEVDGWVEILDGVELDDRIVTGSARALVEGEEVRLT